MKLLKSAASPFVRKVMVTLHETGQLSDVEMLDVSNTPLAPDSAVAAANPVGKIPALIRNDAPTLYDSRVICRFLDQRAQAGLYPERRLYDTLTLEATADGMMEAAVLIVYEERFRALEQVSLDWIEGQWLKVSRSLDALETRWMSHLSGRLDMGQIAIGCALGYLDFRHDARQWRTGHDSLAAWYKTFSARPSMQATAGPAS
ncbi:glutathione S-transferase [Salipiger aestuarii]|uniref:Glutathione S-transferase n=1 Tax=Salipiger aestuarii TaxID=568098 RepID=A0A327YGU1_9RHOB|nr:glutathione S-transferase [Salipiger aestuarii]EIE52192.1 glutathione S-transferase [Citreicella sp. 357]KAA8608406.1 glutathione S-transferase [Salipiger aestuarii]KAA8612317.1 glutathione S-transferase [Salipiger aestuarii]KAB2541450.1 glutathione S-transferase [Salipiger aestuarii]RAK20103.1 glutathione S-transferase [Salipiger aestuarii]